ncbi:MAG: agmatine deiminase family protein [Pseudomonadota bacterium]
MTPSTPPVPSEWMPQRAIWVGWPRLADEWGDAFEAARSEIAHFVQKLSTRLPVRVAIGDDAAERAALAHGIAPEMLRRVPTGDIWLRDTGPVFTQSSGGELLAKCFEFNGWGGKFDMPGDRDTSQAIAHVEDARTNTHSFVLEGGAVDHDGTGAVLTTRECLLNPNRNGWREADAEMALETSLGARRIIWLERGLLNDHTDGHVDNVARFIGPGRVVCQRPISADEAQADRLAEVEDALRAAGLDVETIGSPGDVADPGGEIAPASHMNFVFANGEILFPVYDQALGEAAAAQLAAICPGWRVVPIPSRAILSGAGSFHCMTCNVPANEVHQI